MDDLKECIQKSDGYSWYAWKDLFLPNPAKPCPEFPLLKASSNAKEKHVQEKQLP